MKTKKTVSLCMIVQDEEDCLLAALQSVRGITDELIIVDTGSRDRTPQLALAMGAKLFKVAWRNNFAEARNFALQQATSDWILVLDADEILESIDPEIYSELLSNDQIEGYFLQIRNILDSSEVDQPAFSDQVVRLFRNKPYYRFEGAIHEQVAPSILRANNGNRLTSVPLIINHFGYLRERLHSKEKFTRNSEIIKQELERTPDNPFLLYCLGLEYYQQDSLPEGLNQLSKALRLMSGHEGYFEDVLLNIALGYLRLEDIPSLIDFLSKVLSGMYPVHADFLFLRGTAYFRQGNYLQAAEDIERCLSIGTSKLTTPDKVFCLLGDVYYSSENLPQAHKAYIRALESPSKSSYPWQQLIRVIQKGYPIEDLLDHLWKQSKQEALSEYAHQLLTLTLKELHWCSVIIAGKDRKFIYFNLRNRVERVSQDALLILCNIFSDFRETKSYQGREGAI